MLPDLRRRLARRARRRRNRGRVAIRAMQNFLDAGGHTVDLENLKLSAMMGSLRWSLSIDPLGYLHDLAIGRDDAVELTLELLTDVLALVHPDKHPPERQELAERVTSELLAIKPFVFPRLMKEERPRNTSKRGHDDPFTKVLQTKAKAKAYPCPACTDTVPYFYCDTCKATWEKRRREERERVNAAQRAAYARRKKPRPPTACAAGCGTMLDGRRRHARFCSTACRVRAHRARNTMSGGSA